MKRLIFTFLILINTVFLFSQNNASSGIILGFYTPVIAGYRVNFCQERFIKKNISIDFNAGFYSIMGENGEGRTSTICLGTRFYINSNKNDLKKYWINPFLTKIVTHSGNQGGNEILDSYNIGFTLGMRRYFKKEKFFWDIGVGGSYGYGIYRYYNYTYFGSAPDETSHEDIFSFYPKLILNLGIKY